MTKPRFASRANRGSIVARQRQGVAPAPAARGRTYHRPCASPLTVIALHFQLLFYNSRSQAVFRCDFVSDPMVPLPTAAGPIASLPRVVGWFRIFLGNEGNEAL